MTNEPPTARTVTLPGRSAVPIDGITITNLSDRRVPLRIEAPRSVVIGRIRRADGSVGQDTGSPE